MVQLSAPLGWPLTGEWAPREALFVKLLMTTCQDGGAVLLLVSYLITSLYGRSKSICKPLLQRNPRLAWLLLVWKNKRPPYWISSLCDFDPITVICVLLCLRRPNFAQNWSMRGGVITSYTLSTWWPRRLNTAFGFVLTVFERSNSTWKKISSISDYPWRLIGFQDGSREDAIQLPVSYLMMSLYSKSQNLSAN